MSIWDTLGLIGIAIGLAVAYFDWQADHCACRCPALPGEHDGDRCDLGVKA